MAELNSCLLNSCLVECQVYHRRVQPKRHEFKNRTFFFLIDLDELDSLTNRFRWMDILTTGKNAFYQFDPGDHLPTDLTEASLKARAIRAFQAAGLNQPIAGVHLLTNLRTLGYVFNPLSLYFAFDDHQQCIGVLAQVENTFREMKLFPVLEADSGMKDQFSAKLPKEFYVSPYSTLSQDFRFTVRISEAEITCSVQSQQDQQTMISAGFTGKKLPLTDANLKTMSWRYPLITWQVTALIHLHALILWLKRVPFFLKSDSLHLQTQVLRARPDLHRYSQQQQEVLP